MRIADCPLELKIALGRKKRKRPKNLLAPLRAFMSKPQPFSQLSDLILKRSTLFSRTESSHPPAITCRKLQEPAE